nr:hypothetical protein GTC16762_31010 [Pigmentibacter ruber]
MLSIENVSLSMGRSYYKKDNYYTNEESCEYSKWHGKSAQELQLNGKIDFKQFDNLLFGYTPDGQKILATNAVDPKKYQEPLLTKTERGVLEFSILKIAEKYEIEKEQKEKLFKIVSHYTRYPTKLKRKDYNECIAAFKNTLKNSDLKGQKKEEVIDLLSQALDKVTRPVERRGGYDLTFNAPKSVSIMALVREDGEILQAHRDAVLKTLDVIESEYANTRIGDNTKREIENAKKLIIATFEHDMSREVDPHLHTHCVIFNLINRGDGEWRALHADDLRTYSKYFGMIYQNELAHKIQKLGYEIEVNTNGTFEIKGIPEELKQHFSKRRNQLVNELGVTDQKSARNLVKVERAKKSEKIDHAEEKKRWIREESAFEYDRNHKVNTNDKELNYTEEYKNKKLMESVQDSFSQASDRNVLFHVETAKMNHIQNNFGKYGFDELMNPLNSQIEKDLITVKVEKGVKYLTKESLEIEEKTAEILQKGGNFERILDKDKIKELFEEKNKFSLEDKNKILHEVKDILGKYELSNKENIISLIEEKIPPHIRLSSYEIQSLNEEVFDIVSNLKLKKIEKDALITDLIASISRSSGLNNGQKNAIEETLLSEDRHLIWEGVAGAGKTYSLKTVIDEAKKVGYDVRGFAQNGDAASILSSETGINAQTIDSLVLSKIKEDNPQNSKKLWIIDESGLINAKLGYELAKRADAENARMIIVGGISQLSAPSSGHFLKFVSRYTNIKTVRLDESVRQKNRNLAQGVKYLNAFDLQKLDSVYYKNTAKELAQKAVFHFKNSIEEFKTEEGRIQNAVKYFLSLSESEMNKSLIVAKTHNSIHEITNGIRSGLLERGYLKNQTEVTTYIPVSVSKKQLKYALNYEIGNIVVTENPNTALRANESYLIQERDTINNTITVSDSNGNKFTVKPEHVKDIFQFKAQKINIAENDWMSWRKNSKDRGRLNKQMFKITEINHEARTAKIKYERGTEDTIHLDSLNFMSHSWAVTFNASQGATKKNTIGLIESYCGHEEIYTVFTRSTHSLKIFAESKDAIEKSLLKSKSNLTATEIIKEQKERKYIQKSNKMDFYDKHQKNLVLAKDGNQMVLSIAAPSDVSAYYFTSTKEIRDKILKIHEDSIRQALEHFKNYLKIDGQFQFDLNSKDTIFEKNPELSQIQYIHSDLSFKNIVLNDKTEVSLNQFSFIENQKIIKNLYETILAESLTKELKVSISNESEILRIHERNDHVHALFAEHFEKNISKLKCDKFLSPFELKQFLEKSTFISKNEKEHILNFEHIVTDIPNETKEIKNCLSDEEIVQNALFKSSHDLQIFDETILYQSLLSEAKGNIELSKIDTLMTKLLVHEDLKFLTYDRYGKMLFCYQNLDNEEANILQHSILRKNEKESILSFERVMRRIESENLSNNQAAALLHFTCDEGGVKFISNLAYDDLSIVLNHTKDLYENSAYQVIHSYAGRVNGFKLNDGKELHVRKLVESIEEKRTKLSKDTIIILKDLGKNISSTSSRLFELAEKSGAKVICIANEDDFSDKESKRFLKDLKRTSGVNLKARYKGYEKQRAVYQKYEIKLNRDPEIVNSIEEETTLSSSQSIEESIIINTHEEGQEIPNEFHFDMEEGFSNEFELPPPDLFEHLPTEENITINKLSEDNIEKERLLNIMEKVQEFYVENLFSENGKEALEYLLQRGLTLDEIREYKFGLSHSYGLEQFAKKNGISQKDLIKLSLVSLNQNNSSYDFYRNRIMIPINNSDGKCVGFGGRIYRDIEIKKGVSKYINPKTTQIFNKSTILFGLDKAKESIQSAGEAIVVEGYLDQIALHKSGVKNVVAVLGTALTKEHLNELKSYTNEVTLLFDTDNAGKNAAKRSFFLASGNDIELNYTNISTKDPDEYLRSHSIDELKSELSKNKVPLDHFVSFTYETDEVNFQNIENWKKEVLPKIMLNKDPFERNLAIKTGSQALKVPISYLLTEKQLKFVPDYFLNDEEKKLKNKILNVNSEIKEKKKFENNKISKSRVTNLIEKSELRKAILVEMKNKYSKENFTEEEILKFISENKDLVQSLETMIGYNIEYAKQYYQFVEGKDSNLIQMYKKMCSEFINNTPQKINEILSKQIEEKARGTENSAFIHYEKLKNECESVSKDNFIEIFSLEKGKRNFELYKFINSEFANLKEHKNISALDKKENILLDTISLEKFESYLLNNRLSKAYEYEGTKKFELSQKIRELQNTDLEIKSGFEKLENILPYQREKLLTEIIDNLANNTVNKSFSEEENIKLIESKFLEFTKNLENNKEFRSEIAKSIEQKFVKYKYEYDEKMQLNIERNNKSIKSHLDLRLETKHFEKDVKNCLYQKIGDMSKVNEIFKDARKLLIKESKFIERNQQNDYESYFSFARKNENKTVEHILKDIDLPKMKPSLGTELSKNEIKVENGPECDLTSKNEFNQSYKPIDILCNKIGIENEIIKSEYRFKDMNIDDYKENKFDISEEFSNNIFENEITSSRNISFEIDDIEFEKGKELKIERKQNISLDL